MSNSKTKKVELPEAEVFLTWVRRSISDLGMRPSNFLVDEDVPGSVNRLNNILKNPGSLRMSWARRLEREIRAQAEQQGIELLPFPGANVELALAS